MSGAQQHDGPEASRWTTAAAVMTNNLLKKACAFCSGLVPFCHSQGINPPSRAPGMSCIPVWVSVLRSLFSRHGISNAQPEVGWCRLQGIDIQRCSLVLHLRELEGLTVQVDGTIEKRFSKEEVVHPLQASAATRLCLLFSLSTAVPRPMCRPQVTLRRHPAPDPRVEPEAVAEARQESLANLKPGDRALFLGAKYYGSVATILEPTKAGLDHKGHKVESRSIVDTLCAPPEEDGIAAACTVLGAHGRR